jgi:hypothetical protein
MMTGCFLQSGIDDLPAVPALLRLNLVPEPAKVGDGGLGEAGVCGCILNFAFWAHLRPVKIRVNRLAIKALKGGDSNSWVNEGLVNFHRADHDRFRLSKCQY